ncbi:hypothetical protein [uncultured Sphingomonas sp.]|jgi:hypothetical protein|uniref:hypothetical protein n=1 Tax=unclassified Sphingomonas TaxID=196159 RepID=UPI0025E7174F|nr:hypothetical protein [uncultured Sphingomonas sp.]
MSDQHYYYDRAEQELEMAQKASCPEAVKAHYTLAGFYLDRVHGGPQEPAKDGQSRSEMGEYR